MPIRTSIWHTTRTTASETRHDAASVVVKEVATMDNGQRAGQHGWHLIGGVTPTTSSSTTHSVFDGKNWRTAAPCTIAREGAAAVTIDNAM